MSRQIKLQLKSLLEVKKSKIIPIATTSILIILLIVLSVISAVKPEPGQANLKTMAEAASLSASEKTTVANPHPYYNVKLSVDGETTAVKVTGTVNDAIKTAGIEVDEDDLINIGLNEPLNYSTDIKINRVEVVETVKLETIEYATEFKEDDNYVLGYEKVLVDGEDGEIEKHIRHTYVDGKLTATDVVSTEVVEPVDQVIVKGTSEINPIQEMSISVLEVPDTLVLDENGVPTSYSNVHTGKSCAYSAKPTAKTASGRQVKVGHVAVDPSIIPYGTELYIVSTDGKYVYGYAIAADTGTGLIEGICLVDLFMESYDASCEWGAKQVNIYVLN